MKKEKYKKNRIGGTAKGIAVAVMAASTLGAGNASNSELGSSIIQQNDGADKELLSTKLLRKNLATLNLSNNEGSENSYFLYPDKTDEENLKLAVYETLNKMKPGANELKISEIYEKIHNLPEEYVFRNSDCEFVVKNNDVDVDKWFLNLDEKRCEDFIELLEKVEEDRELMECNIKLGEKSLNMIVVSFGVNEKEWIKKIFDHLLGEEVLKLVKENYLNNINELSLDKIAEIIKELYLNGIAEKMNFYLNEVNKKINESRLNWGAEETKAVILRKIAKIIKKLYLNRIAEETKAVILRKIAKIIKKLYLNGIAEETNELYANRLATIIYDLYLNCSAEEIKGSSSKWIIEKIKELSLNRSAKIIKESIANVFGVILALKKRLNPNIDDAVMKKERAYAFGCMRYAYQYCDDCIRNAYSENGTGVFYPFFVMAWTKFRFFENDFKDVINYLGYNPMDSVIKLLDRLQRLILL